LIVKKPKPDEQQNGQAVQNMLNKIICLKMKPTEDLMHEHKAIKVMLSIMSKIAENIRNQKKTDSEEIEKLIDFADKCHHGKEETVLFPALVDAGMSDQSGPVAVMLHEHDLGRGFIKNMALSVEAMKAGDISAINQVAESMEEYVSLLHNHIQKEENILFPMADKLLPEEKQYETFIAFERIEEEVVGHGVHERYHEFLNQLKAKYQV
jgi:hemerythrin-like domain-containing protein